MPVAATRHDAAGAKAFAEFFIKTVDWGFATTNSSYMRHYFTNACIGCRSVAGALDRDRQAGHYYVGDRFAITATSVPELAASRLKVRVTFDVSASEVLDRDGRFVAGEAALSGYHEALTLDWRAAGWAVEDMDQR